MHYIGVDYLERYSYIVVKDGEGQLERRGTVNNNIEEPQHFLEPYRLGKAVLEATMIPSV